MTSYPRPPAHIEPYVRVLGVQVAIEVLLTFGGGEIYLTSNPKRRARLVDIIGAEKATELSEVIGRLKVRIPLAKPWIACCMKADGLSVAEISRRLHAADNTVRRWFAHGDSESPESDANGKDPRQMSLF